MSEVKTAAAWEVCEWTRTAPSSSGYYALTHDLVQQWAVPNFCPSCGRRVVIKEG